MTRFQKIQLASSIIPGVSTLFISIVTMILLKKNQASKKYWTVFYIAYLFMFFGTSIIVKLFLPEYNMFLQNVVTGLLLAILNIIFIGMQIAISDQQHEFSSTCVKFTSHLWCIMWCIVMAVAIVFICVPIF